MHALPNLRPWLRFGSNQIMLVNPPQIPPPVFPARDRGKSPPRLHKARIEVSRIKAHHHFESHSPLEAHAAILARVGPMKPLQGPTPIVGKH
jgi:hypothetical protein